MTNEAALQRLIDESDLRNLVMGMPKTLDARDFDAYGELFLEDAVFDLAGDVRQGRKAIVDGPNRDLVPLYEATFHQLGQIYVDVHGDEAEMVAYCVAYHLPKASAFTEHANAGGKYRCEASRTPDGWRFTRVTLELNLLWGSVPFFSQPD
ncbi:MAG TPA: nuclear transport factor 2 family protein [Vicinamibacterales bacterium]|nr:nuclear transport factor 2 family protein [Vicinamibacterales bacterium]